MQRHRDGERQARLYALEAGEVHCDPLRDVVERDGDNGHQPREGDAPFAGGAHLVRVAVGLGFS